MKDGRSKADGNSVNDEPGDGEEGKIRRRGSERGALPAMRACVLAEWRTSIPRPRERETLATMRTSHLECGLTRQR